MQSTNCIKKLILTTILLTLSKWSFAEDARSQINAGLIDHVAIHSQYTTRGENRLALLADIIDVGKFNGSAIGQLRVGFTEIMNPNENVTRGAGYVGDIYINVSPFIRKCISLNPSWKFLNSIEMGPSYAYDFRQHHSYFSFSVGLAFNLNPIQ